MPEQPETLTKEQMAARLGMSVEVFDMEIKNAGQHDSFEGLNRKERRKLQRLMRRKGVK